MMPNQNDPLWDPAQRTDAQLLHFEHLLLGYRGKTTPARAWKVCPDVASVHPSAKKWRHPRWVRATFAVAAACLLIVIAHHYRLSWPTDRAWSAQINHAPARALAPGQSVQTLATQHLRLLVARIGRIELSPGSELTLESTSSAQHRVRLAHGHMRAKIWAPPGLFAVSAGQAEVIDLGCEFELWRNQNGVGRVQVQSGWVAFREGGAEVLLPAQYTLQFDAEQIHTPLHQDASTAFANAVKQLDQAMIFETESSRSELGNKPSAVLAAANAVAQAAQTADRFTLLHLMTKHPRLAASGMYERLAQALGVTQRDRAHQHAWINGELPAINAWWDLLPTSPKHWWQNWRDA
jgi:hypothetical protein